MKKVHPQPASEPETEKKLRRLPQVFSRVLELPFPRDTNVRTFFTVDADYFIVPPISESELDEVKVHNVTIQPWGITRVVVHIGPGEPNPEDGMVYDKWRFRLSKTTIPLMTMAYYVNRHLVVIVPNRAFGDDENKGTSIILNEGKGDGGERKCEKCGGAHFISAA